MKGIEQGNAMRVVCREAVGLTWHQAGSNLCRRTAGLRQTSTMHMYQHQRDPSLGSTVTQASAHHHMSVEHLPLARSTPRSAVQCW